MKLYTEEQLHKLIIRYRQNLTEFSLYKPTTQHLIDELTPIELPTDEEVEKYINSFPYTKHLDDGQYNDGVMVGAELGIEWYKQQLKLKGDKQ